MSIADEILRLQTAKSDLATSIANKGVAVPANATLDDYADLVDQIQQGGASVLPYDAQVEYLQSSGTQYIDTQVVLTANYHVEIDVAFISGTSFETALGSLTSPDKFSVLLGANSSGRPYMQIGNDISYVYYTQNVNYYDGTIRHYICSGNSTRQYLTCNGVTANAAVNGTLSDLSLYLFARHRSDDGTGNYLIGKIGKTYINSGYTLVRDFIPVRVGQVGYMYDRVSGKLFGNSGTGSFTLGNDV